MGQVAIYCRVSTIDQSCERQQRDLRAITKRPGYKIVATFHAMALAPMTTGPSARRRWLAQARQARKINAIPVMELSRWGRSTQDLVKILDHLHGWQVSILAQSGLSFDLGTSSGKLMRTGWPR